MFEAHRRRRERASRAQPAARTAGRAGPAGVSENPLLQSSRIVLGLLGGIASGKSHVARRTAALAGGVVVDADALAHEVLQRFARDGRLASELGSEFVRDGEADVAALGASAFADPALLRDLERLLHPPVHARILAALERHAAGTGPALLVLDVALLIEVGLDRRCDALWYVDVPESVRVERAGARGLTLEQVRLREAYQSPLERKRARADLVVRNDVDDAELDRQILAGLSALGLPAAPQPGARAGARTPEAPSSSPRTE